MLSRVYIHLMIMVLYYLTLFLMEILKLLKRLRILKKDFE